MGCFNSKVLSPDGFYWYGPTDFEYNTKKALFEKSNGLLFRLVNDERKQWAFYNDTKEYDFIVTTTFGPESSNLIALGKTSLMLNHDGTYTSTNVIHPGYTEPYIQGDISGFDTTVEAVFLDNKTSHRVRYVPTDVVSPRD
ncbi:unnamed protein product [Phytomonas sp. EM1]|nr:unnamed protein product [Phytomonas sp. EM1]|eukprot:CCW64473.1 unnamed protein product [Phytomonas sp. isolate EM1]